MRKLLFVVAAAGLLLVALAPVAVGDDDNEFKASLNGYLEVPSIATAARGSFRAELHGSTLRYRLTVRDFSEDPLFAHIHFARPDVNWRRHRLPVRRRWQTGVPAERHGDRQHRRRRRRRPGPGHRPR